MHKVNLIRGWQNTGIYRSYRHKALLTMVVITSILLVVYLAFFGYFIYLQKQVSQLSQKELVTQSGYKYTTEELAKAIYSLKKLDEIKKIYLDYPEYKMYHQFLLDHILNYSSFTIDNYALDRSHIVKVALSTGNLNDIFSLVEVLESSKVSRYFSALDITSINSTSDDKNESSLYRIEFSLKFNSRLLDEKS
jgi:hypothetical protein